MFEGHPTAAGLSPALSSGVCQQLLKGSFKQLHSIRRISFVLLEPGRSLPQYGQGVIRPLMDQAPKGCHQALANTICTWSELEWRANRRGDKAPMLGSSSNLWQRQFQQLVTPAFKCKKATLNRPRRNGLPRHALKQPHNSYRWLPVVEQEIPNRQGVDLFVGQ